MRSPDSAVSPVIGVLLMLTLTLIIAAIVSSYAGGLMEIETKVPSITMQVSFHQHSGLELRDMGGDPFPTSAVTALIRPSENMGENAPRQISPVNKSFITDISDSAKTWESGVSVMRPGDVCNISISNISEIQKSVSTDEYHVLNPSKKGCTFFLELYSRNTMISRNEVLIEE